MYDDKMQPGEYKITCEAAKDAPWKDGWRTELNHRVIDGPHTGTALRSRHAASSGGEMMEYYRLSASRVPEVTD